MTPNLSSVFKRFLAAATQQESGLPVNFTAKAKHGFRRLASNGTQLDFPQFEQVTANETGVARSATLCRVWMFFPGLFERYIAPDGNSAWSWTAVYSRRCS